MHTSREGQLLLDLSYDAKLSDVTLSKIIAIIKDPNFKAGMLTSYLLIYNIYDTFFYRKFRIQFDSFKDS